MYSRLSTLRPSSSGRKALRRLLQRSGQLVEDLMSDVLPKHSSDTTLELNLAMLKFRHTVHREKEE